MGEKSRDISENQVTSLKTAFAGYLKMRQRVDAVNQDLERLHERITRLTLQLLERGEQGADKLSPPNAPLGKARTATASRSR
jgi:hypothetical protein